MRPHPHLYEINTWPWLAHLSQQAGVSLTLARVPDCEWDLLRARGIDLVYLMGIWRRSAHGRRIALSTPAVFETLDRALPGWTTGDVPGSAYCIAGYDPDPRLGTWEELAEVRAKLHARGMQLIVDFIPNHTGFDHPWTLAHPDRYIQTDLTGFRRNPHAFRVVETAAGEARFLACGRDPYFLPWSDVAQLDYSNPETRAAMVAELERLAERVDGARCDMAMLVLSEVFSGTWKDYLRQPMPPAEFWSDARAAVPDLLLLGEVYWDLEWRLQQLGFDFTYDKRLYDRLLHSSANEVRGHLMATPDYQRRSARFIENHDEPRSASAFGERIHAAATVAATIPGLRFFHQGQLEGWTHHLPVQLGRWRNDPINQPLRRFYERLLSAADADVFHSGDWRLLDVAPAGDPSNVDLLAWRWLRGAEMRLMAVNLGNATAHGLVQLPAELPTLGDAEVIVFDDVLNRREYSWTRTALQRGLYVRLEKGAAHLFRVNAT